jgi:hypothetical protein
VQLLGGIPGGGSSSGSGPPALFAWHQPATITPDNAATFVELARRILDGRAKQLGIELGLHRFSDATTRTSAIDRIVDLVIALESMFSEDADSISYKASQRASAVLAPLGLSSASVYSFVKTAYACRSKVVHGKTPSPKNLAGERCKPEEHAHELDRLVAALLRQILCSSSREKPYAAADKLISSALDSQRASTPSGVSARYDIAVTHDGSSFRAIPPGDNTSWVLAATQEELRARLADVIALWTQTPCGSDQIHFKLDDDALGASP